MLTERHNSSNDFLTSLLPLRIPKLTPKYPPNNDPSIKDGIHCQIRPV